MTSHLHLIAWQPLAREDLRGIVRYIGKDSPARAERFGETLRTKVTALARHPELGRPGRLPGLRELVVHPNYIVFHRVLDAKRTVQIVRVKHAARQMP